MNKCSIFHVIVAAAFAAMLGITTASADGACRGKGTYVGVDNMCHGPESTVQRASEKQIAEFARKAVQGGDSKRLARQGQGGSRGASMPSGPYSANRDDGRRSAVGDTGPASAPAPAARGPLPRLQSNIDVQTEYETDCKQEGGTLIPAEQWNQIQPGANMPKGGSHCHRPARWVRESP